MDSLDSTGIGQVIVKLGLLSEILSGVRREGRAVWAGNGKEPVSSRRAAVRQEMLMLPRKGQEGFGEPKDVQD